MMLVVWMHVCNNVTVPEKFLLWNRFVSSMYMPCFFIMSGFFIRDEKTATFAKKKAFTLLWPLLFIYVMSYLFAFVCQRLNPHLLKNDVDFMNIFYSRNFTNGPIWFLASLFVALMVVNVSNSLIQNKIYRFLVILIIVFLGYYWNDIAGVRLPLFIDTGLVAAFFVYAGRWVRQIVATTGNRWEALLLGVVSVLPCMAYGQGCSMQTNSYPSNFIAFMATAVIGSMAILFIAKSIGHNRLLEYMGRHSLIVLCFHMFSIMGVAAVMKIMGMNDDVTLIATFTCSVLLCYVFIPIVKRALFFVFP